MGAAWADPTSINGRHLNGRSDCLCASGHWVMANQDIYTSFRNALTADPFPILLIARSFILLNVISNDHLFS